MTRWRGAACTSSSPRPSAYNPETGDALARNIICVAMTRALDNLNVFVMEEAKEKAVQDQAGARSGGATGRTEVFPLTRLL
jgi:hypothetical protein